MSMPTLSVEVEPGMRLNVFLGMCDGDSRLCEINHSPPSVDWSAACEPVFA